MSSSALTEEYEVLESIYPDEIEKTADDELEIRVDPEEQPTNEEDQIRLVLKVHCPPDYPDVLPDLTIATSQGEISSAEEESLLSALHDVGKESIGMAMIFTLVSQLQESLRSLVDARVAKRKQIAEDAARREEEIEQARTKGTPVTPSSFAAWKMRFDQELSRKAAAEEDDRLKTMTPKERDEYKRSKIKLSGRHLFERDRNLANDDIHDAEDGVVSVDINQYDRRAAREAEEEDRVVFSDSD